MLSSGLVQQAQAFVSDSRLPQTEGQAFRLHLIRVLHEQGEALAKVKKSSAYLSQCRQASEACSSLQKC